MPTFFSFNSTGGTYNISVGRDNPSGVDVKVSIFDANGNLLAFEDGDPRAAPLRMVNDAQLTLHLGSGKYYVMVQSHGNYGDQGLYVVRVDPMAAGWQATDIGLIKFLVIRATMPQPVCTQSLVLEPIFGTKPTVSNSCIRLLQAMAQSLPALHLKRQYQTLQLLGL